MTSILSDDKNPSKVPRACDRCRRRKIKCNGSQTEDGVCSTCVSSRVECTYGEYQQRRRKTNAYVHVLEDRLAAVEEILKTQRPELNLADLVDYLDAPTISSSLNMSTPTFISPEVTRDFYAAASPAPPVNDDLELSDDEGQQTGQVTKLREGVPLVYPSYFGKSGNAALIQHLLSVKQDKTGRPPEPFNCAVMSFRSRRPEFWTSPPWENNIREGHLISAETYSFPAPDLMSKVLDRYFAYMNLLLPLLHRPSFERSIKDGLHLRDGGFARVLLLACAVGSRGVSDPRVLLPDSQHTASAGWAWYEQARKSYIPFVAPATLYDVQAHCLAIMYIGGTSRPQTSWAQAAVGLLIMQNLGAHRGKLYSETPCVAEELWKRAFWILTFFDRYTSMGIGRSCAVQDEDYDLPLPTDCDDQYWEPEDPAQAFIQPEGKPSKIAAFIHLVKLHRVLSLALRNLFAVNRKKTTFAAGVLNWEEKVTSELQVAMNTWIETMPRHLRWDPTRHDLTYFHQSAFLHAMFCRVQMVTYQRFIIPKGPERPLFASSIQACARAANTCSWVLTTIVTRTKSSFPMYFACFSAYHSAANLILIIIVRRRAGCKQFLAEDMAALQRCMDFLKWSYASWHHAGNLWMQLKGLVSEEDNPPPKTLSHVEQDRAIARDDSSSAPSSISSPSSSNDYWPAYGEVTSALPPGITSYEAPTILSSANFVEPAYDFSSTFAESHGPPEGELPEAWWDTLKDPSTMPDWLQFPVPPFVDMSAAVSG